jgi:BASS family bile acid:Na+ symporter
MGRMSPEFIQLVQTDLVPAGLMLIMFSMGLTLAPRDFSLVARNPLLVGMGFGTHLLVLPVLGLAVGALFRLSPELALGLFIISICPAGTTSNALTFVGRGNVALAVVLTALTSLVTVFTIPIVLSWAIPWFLSGRGANMPELNVVRTILQLAEIVVIPIAIGMVGNHFLPTLAARVARWLRPTSFVILIAVIAFSVAISVEMVLDNLVRAAPAIVALNLSAMAFGLGIGRIVGANARDSMTLAIETGVQNVSLALVLTLTVLDSLPLAVIQNVYGVVMLANASLLILWWRRRIRAENP